MALIAERQNFPAGDKVPLRDLPGITLRALPALMMPVVLLGFIYSGVTTHPRRLARCPLAGIVGSTAHL